MTPRLALLALALSAATTAPGCTDDPAGPSLGDADVRILFIGNSLTYANDLPGLVETIAEAAGHSVETAVVAYPDCALEDHWFNGAPALIRELAPDLVVMQQGPSTLPSSQVHLREWTDSLARVAREVGAEPALLMVWPPDDPRYSFGAVLASYRGAAEAVGGVFIPAGVAWLEAWKRDSALALYAPDRFHPAPLGSVVAALTVVATLFETDLASLPPTMTPAGAGRPDIRLTAETAAVVFPAVERAVADHAIR